MTMVYGKKNFDIKNIKFAVDFIWNLGWTSYSLIELYEVMNPVFIAIITNGRRIRRIGYNMKTGKWKLLPDVE